MNRNVSGFSLGLLFVTYATLSGCASPSRTALNPAPLMPATTSVAPVGTIGNNDGSVLDLDTEFQDSFIYRPVHKGDRLPDKFIKSVSLTDTAILDALRLLLKGTPVSLSMTNAANQNGAITGTVTAYNLSGNLPDVVERLSDSAGFFYKYSQGTLNIYPDEQFVVSLPPIINEDVFAGMANTMQKLGATDTYLDRYGRTLTFRANRLAMRAIDGYLDNVRETRSIIVFDTYVYQVDLSDGTQTGIKWNNLAIAVSPGGTLGALTATGGAPSADPAAMGFSAIYKGSRFSLDALFSFLQTQGNVKTIAQPKMAIISGSKGNFKVGSTTKYVSEVGTNSSTMVNQTTVKTETVLSGLELALTGDVSDGTVYARIKLSLSELIRFNSFEALGTKLQLPQTTARELNTAVRARPGDVVLLGGVNNSRDDADYSGLPGANGGMLATTSAQRNVARSELVMVLKPKVVRFVNPKKEAEKLAALNTVRVADPLSTQQPHVAPAIAQTAAVVPEKVVPVSVQQPAKASVGVRPKVEASVVAQPSFEPTAIASPVPTAPSSPLTEGQKQVITATQAPTSEDGSLVLEVKSGDHVVAKVNITQEQIGEKAK